MASPDWSQCPAVESIPGKVSGAWVLRGTRMPVSVIFENLEAGANIDDILNWFALDLPSIEYAYTRDDERIYHQDPPRRFHKPSARQNRFQRLRFLIPALQ